ncbi:MAG: hypothetical protein AAF329_27020 [Cyanobacteria bacterium P01_A01_bin.17]
MSTPKMLKSAPKKSPDFSYPDHPESSQKHERSTVRPHWLNTAIGSTLQYALEREAEWARG